MSVYPDLRFDITDRAYVPDYSIMKHQWIIVCMLIIATRTAVTAPITLHIDNTHSSIQFSVPFFGISEVTGRFERFCGTLVLDEANIGSSRMELFIDASSINTGLKVRDRDLVEKYLETKKHPIIYFTSSSIRVSKPKQFEVTGALRLHGISKELHIVLTIIGDIINGDKARELGFKLQPISLSRTEYSIMEGTTGGGSVGDTVSISAVIRVRDVTPYRKDIDVRYPEKNAGMTLPFDGSFKSSSGASIKLVSDSGHYFLAFSDDEWSWFAQATVVGPNLFKLRSFSQLLELKGGTVAVTMSDGRTEVFTREAEH